MPRPTPVSPANTKSEYKDNNSPVVKEIEPSATEQESSQQVKNTCEPGLPADTGNGLSLHRAAGQNWNGTHI